MRPQNNSLDADGVLAVIFVEVKYRRGPAIDIRAFDNSEAQNVIIPGNFS